MSRWKMRHNYRWCADGLLKGPAAGQDRIPVAYWRGNVPCDSRLCSVSPSLTSPPCQVTCRPVVLDVPGKSQGQRGKGSSIMDSMWGCRSWTSSLEGMLVLLVKRRGRREPVVCFRCFCFRFNIHFCSPFPSLKGVQAPDTISLESLLC